jgi:hypothetical protein
MIQLITHPAQLAGGIGQDLLSCIKRYCEKADDETTPELLQQTLEQRVFPQYAVPPLPVKPTAWLFLAFDERLRVRGFAVMRPLAEWGRPADTAQFWHVYMDPKAPPGLFAEGFNVIRDFFRKRGITRFQFCSARDVEGLAWARLLRPLGFKESAVIFELDTSEVIDDGKSENRPAGDGHHSTVPEAIHQPTGVAHQSDGAAGRSAEPLPRPDGDGGNEAGTGLVQPAEQRAAE